MNIAVIGPRGIPDIPGGVEKYCEELYSRLVNFGYNISIFVRSSYYNKRIYNWKGIKLLYIWCPRIEGFETFFYSFLSVLKVLFKNFEIVHFHNIGPSFFIPFVKIFGKRIVVTYHSINYLHKKWNFVIKLVLKLCEYLAVNYADKVIVVSKSTYEFLKKKYRKNNIVFIPNSVSFKFFLKITDNLLKKYSIETKKYILSVGRFVPEKGLHDLIFAYRKINNPQFKLVIVGDADYHTLYSKNLKILAEQTKGVVLIGKIDSSSLNELYYNCGLFVLPSYHEGLSTVLLEALSFEIPVLLSDIPQNKDLKLYDFRYFKVGNIEDLKEKILKLFNLEISEEEKIQYRNIIKENYSWDKNILKILEIYKNLKT